MFKKSIQLARILSLDVVLGSVIGTLFIAKILEVQLPHLFVLALAICVWLIYTADHLADAISIPHDAHTHRHRFHQKYLKPITIVFCLIALPGIIILIQFPFQFIIWGSSVLGMVGLYFISIRKLSLQNIIPKEFVIAFLYSIGIFLAPVYLKLFPLSITVWVLFAEYTLIALSNLILFSWYEKELDEKDLHISVVTLIGKKKSKRVLNICFALLYVIILYAIIFLSSNTGFLYAQGIILPMTITLHSILLLPAFFSQYERYRSFADAIFLYPIVYLFL